MVSVQGSGRVNGSVVTPGAGTPLAGDVIWYLGVTGNGSPALPSSVAGCGGTWTSVHAGARGTVWVCNNATSIGAITPTGGNIDGAAAWWLRGASTQVTISESNGVGPVTLTGAPTTVGTTQAALALCKAADTMPATGTLPTVGDWTASSTGTTKTAWALPVTPNTFSIVSTRSAATRSVLLQVVVGTPPPTAPTGLTLTPGLTNILAAWTAPTGTPATGYTVKVGAAAPVDVGNVTSYDVTGLAQGTLYDIEVRAYNVGGTSAPVSGSVTTLELPDPPTGLVQTSASPTSVGLAWTAPVAGPPPSSYEYRVNGGVPVDVGLVTACVVLGLSPSTTYTVEVRSVSAST